MYIKYTSINEEKFREPFKMQPGGCKVFFIYKLLKPIHPTLQKLNLPGRDLDGFFRANILFS